MEHLIDFLKTGKVFGIGLGSSPRDLEKPGTGRLGSPLELQSLGGGSRASLAGGQLLRNKLNNLETTLGLRHPLVAAQYWVIANNLLKCGQLREAETYCRKAVEIQEAVFPANHPDLARSRETLKTWVIRV